MSYDAGAVFRHVAVAARPLQVSGNKRRLPDRDLRCGRNIAERFFYKIAAAGVRFRMNTTD